MTLTAAFRPERLGAATSISFSIRIDPTAQAGPLPLSSAEVSYPTDLGLATSGLGLEACDPHTLETEGPEACPPNAKMGAGNALVDVQFGPEIVPEDVGLDIYASPSSDGYLHLAILARGWEPVIAQIVISAVLLPGRLQIVIPPIATLPLAPYAAVVDLHATIGGALTYYERAHGRTIAYRPRGIGLPDTCPRGGFRLATSLGFTDGQRSTGATVIPCPQRRSSARGRSTPAA